MGASSGASSGYGSNCLSPRLRPRCPFLFDPITKHGPTATHSPELFHQPTVPSLSHCADTSPTKPLRHSTSHAPPYVWTHREMFTSAMPKTPQSGGIGIV